MMFNQKAAMWVAAGALATGGAATAVSPAAQAGTAPVTVTFAISPHTASVGDTVTVTGTATNNTSSTVSGSLGIQNPDYANEHITAVSGHACAPRNVTKTIYCGNTQIAPRETLTITLTFRVTAAGTDKFTIYSAMTGTSAYYAYGTLTAS